jgi:hypothetical protein
MVIQTNQPCVRYWRITKLLAAAEFKKILLPGFIDLSYLDNDMRQPPIAGSPRERTLASFEAFSHYCTECKSDG